MEEQWQDWFEERNVASRETICRRLFMNRDEWIVTYCSTEQTVSMPMNPCYGFHEDAPTLTATEFDTRARRVSLIHAATATREPI